LFECHIELDVDQIKPYESNPRRTQNPRFADIKASIRACGVRNPITVTRRPGEAHFIVESGGNTRLLAVQQLWSETGDARFARLSVRFRPWRNESQVLIAHLIENEQRGDMTFWDKANGIVTLKIQLEAEQGRALSLRQLQAHLQQVGITLSHTTLSCYRFATERLRDLGDVITDLSGGAVTYLQPRLNLIQRYAQSRAALDDKSFYAQLLQPVFRQHANDYLRTRVFRPEALCRDCEQALAQYLQEPVTLCRSGIAVLAKAGAGMAVTMTGSGEQQDDAAPAETLSATAAEPVDVSGAQGDYSASPRRAAGSVNPPYSSAVAAVTPASKSLPVAPATERSAAITSGPAALGIAEVESTTDAQCLAAEIAHFARVADIQGCLRPLAALPGYSLLPLPPQGDTAFAPLTMRGWWLLSLLCGGSEAVGVAAPVRPARVPDSAPIVDQHWLFDPVDEAACSFRRIMVLWRAASVQLADADGGNRVATCVMERV
jgi:ParB family protein of integrating conjugative element (PFGI_1 class)